MPEELTLIQKLAIIMKGDVPGHEFHGNQYTGGEGATGEGLLTGAQVKSAIFSPKGIEAFNQVMMKQGYLAYPNNHPMFGGCGVVAKALLNIYPNGKMVAIGDRITPEEGQNYPPIFVQHYAVQIGPDKFVDAEGERSFEQIKKDSDPFSFTSRWEVEPATPSLISRFQSIATCTDQEAKDYANALLEASGSDQVVKGDKPGHDFHGNQYEEVASEGTQKVDNVFGYKLPTGWSRLVDQNGKDVDPSVVTLVSDKGNKAIFPEYPDDNPSRMSDPSANFWQPALPEAKSAMATIDQYASGVTLNFLNQAGKNAMGAFNPKHPDTIEIGNYRKWNPETRLSNGKTAETPHNSINPPYGELGGWSVSSMFKGGDGIRATVLHELGHLTFFGTGHEVNKIYDVLEQTKKDIGDTGRAVNWENAHVASIRRALVASSKNYSGIILEGKDYKFSYDERGKPNVDELTQRIIDDGVDATFPLTEAQASTLSRYGTTRYGATNLGEMFAETYAMYRTPQFEMTPLMSNMAKAFNWGERPNQGQQ
jgi:hypothetical protein